MHKEGFSLVQTTLYIALFTFLLSLMLRTTIHDIVQQITIRTKSMQQAEINGALQRFMRDLCQAPCAQSKWLNQLKHQVIWQTDDAVIGWFLEKETLLRRQGTYDTKKNNWVKKTTSIAARGIKKISFDYSTRDSIIQAVAITLEDEKGRKYHHYTALRNRIL